MEAVDFVGTCQQIRSKLSGGRTVKICAGPVHLNKYPPREHRAADVLYPPDQDAGAGGVYLSPELADGLAVVECPGKDVDGAGWEWDPPGADEAGWESDGSYCGQLT